MNGQGRNAAASQLSRAERALRAHWRGRNLYLPSDRVTSALAAQKNNERAAIRWYLGEIRLLRLRLPGLTTSVFGRAPNQLRSALPGHPVQIWTRAVSSGRSAGARASWFPLPAGGIEPGAGERPLTG